MGTKAVLDQGFDFKGTRVPLMGPQGIFKPRIMELPLSITTAPPSPRKPRPYDDEMGEDSLIRYRYRGTDPDHPDNVGLRGARRLGIPLIYNVGMVPAGRHGISRTMRNLPSQAPRTPGCRPHHP